MTGESTATSLAQQFWSVKSQVNTQLHLFPELMIHHKLRSNGLIKEYLLYREGIDRTYDVSKTYRILTPSLLNKRYDNVRRCLSDVVGLTKAQTRVALNLLRFWAYYGQITPRASTIAGEYDETPQMAVWRAEHNMGAPPHRGEVGTATVWRTVRRLSELGLMRAIPRRRIHPHAKISTFFNLTGLLIVIARYLAEHGVQFFEKWLKPYLSMPGSQFWQGWGLSRGLPGEDARIGSRST